VCMAGADLVKGFVVFIGWEQSRFVQLVYLARFPACCVKA